MAIIQVNFVLHVDILFDKGDFTMACSNQSLSCCPEKQFVQDQVCGEFSAAGVIYTNALGSTSVSSGYIQNTGGDSITATFNDAAATTLTIPAGSTASFTVRGFTTITMSGTGDIIGEFCVTTRYRIQ